MFNFINTRFGYRLLICISETISKQIWKAVSSKWSFLFFDLQSSIFALIKQK